MIDETFQKAKQISQIDPFELLDKYTSQKGKRLKIKSRMKKREEKKTVYADY